MDHSSSSGINRGKKQQDREEWGVPAGEVEDLMGGVGATILWGHGDEPAWGTCTGVPGLGGGRKVAFFQENSVGSALCTPNSVQVTLGSRGGAATACGGGHPSPSQASGVPTGVTLIPPSPQWVFGNVGFRKLKQVLCCPHPRPHINRLPCSAPSSNPLPRAMPWTSFFLHCKRIIKL